MRSRAKWPIIPQAWPSTIATGLLVISLLSGNWGDWGGSTDTYQTFWNRKTSFKLDNLMSEEQMTSWSVGLLFMCILGDSPKAFRVFWITVWHLWASGLPYTHFHMILKSDQTCLAPPIPTAWDKKGNQGYSASKTARFLSRRQKRIAKS